MNNELTNRAQLYRKVETVSNEIGKMEQDGNNTFSRYKYITHEAVTTAIRPLLRTNQLSLVFEMLDYTETNFEDAKGKMVIRTVVKMAGILTDTETGHQERHIFFGAEQDTGGKSMQQAITQCTKYFTFKLFKITSKEEKDPDEKTTTAARRKPVQKGKTEDELVKEGTAKIQACETPEAIKAIYEAATTPVKLRIFEAAKVKGAQLKAVQGEDMQRWVVKSGVKEYTVTHHNINGWACSCPAVKECKHIKSKKEETETN